ncbi:hypothetical protein niasHS_000635 [Heterodera schachtii]|uniref:Uncharacterized protein n=1 Tax=Heterodera schachtii TaxID=97005 RepID=A0ABD2K583_HETSC
MAIAQQKHFLPLPTATHLMLPWAQLGSNGRPIWTQIDDKLHNFRPFSMAFLRNSFAHFLLIFCATFSSVRANLCAFGCREFPQHQIVSSAQFRSFIMPRERGDCGGECCGGGTECGGATESDENGERYGGGTERKPKTDDGEREEEEEEKHKNVLPDIATFLKSLFPRQNAAEKAVDKKSVWYSTGGDGQTLSEG